MSPIAKHLIGAAIISGLVATATYQYHDASEGFYQASAKVLLLAPQEQYLPTLEVARASDPSADVVDPTSEIRELLNGPVIVDSIMSRHRLDRNDGFTKPSQWQQMLTFFGLRAFQSTGSILVAERVRKWTQIDYQPSRRLLTIAFKAPDPNQASLIANDLAQSYLDKVKLRQSLEFDAAVEKLNSDTVALQTRLQTTNDNMAVQIPPSDLSDDQLAAWTKGENLRIVQLRKKATAEFGMLDHMLSRYQEAQTRRSLDLLPPKARLLARATIPVLPINTGAFGQAALNGVMSFCVVMLWAGFVSFRKKRCAQKGTSVPPIPQAVDLSLPSLVQPAQLQQSEIPFSNLDDHTYPSFKSEPITSPVISSNDDLICHASDIICRSSHRRIVFMSDEKNWGGHYQDVVRRVAERDISLISICLGETQSTLGISDLVDGDAICAQVVSVNEETGIHSIGVGMRALASEDFFSHNLHAFFLALEATYDVLLIDIGPHFDDEFALQSLGLTGDALACIYAPDTDPVLSHQVYDVMQHFGYQDCMVLPMEVAGAQMQDVELEQFEAAE